MLPCRHFIEDDAKREQVGTSVEGLAQSLLGGHVRDGAHGDAGASELEIVLGDVGGKSGRGGGGALGNFGEAKVENLGASALG